MDRKFLFSYLKIKRNLLLTIGAFCFIAYYIWNNRNYPGEEYYLYGNAKFLVFSTAYYLLLVSRIKFYQSIKDSTAIRIGEQNRIQSIQRIEQTISIIYLVTIFIALPVSQGINNWSHYIIALVLWGLVWSFNYFIFAYFIEYNQKEMYGPLLSISIIISYCYYVFPAICVFIGV